MLDVDMWIAKCCNSKDKDKREGSGSNFDNENRGIIISKN